MRITVLERIPMQTFFDAFRAAPLEGTNDYVFRGARMELRHVLPREINLTTFYVLRTVLDRQRHLRRELLKQDIDTLHLVECLRLRDEDDPEGREWVMMPPLVGALQEEVVFQPHGVYSDSVAYKDRVRLLVPAALDGHHRLFMADQDKPDTKVLVVHITGARFWEHPYYAYPNGWEHVKVYEKKEDVPQDRKKLYRRNPPNTRLENFRVLGYSGGPGTGRK